MIRHLLFKWFEEARSKSPHSDTPGPWEQAGFEGGEGIYTRKVVGGHIEVRPHKDRNQVQFSIGKWNTFLDLDQNLSPENIVEQSEHFLNLMKGTPA